MATTARSTIRGRMGPATGFFFSSTSTGAGDAGGTTVVDTAVLRHPETKLTNKWLLITSGTNDGESRRISSVSTSTITVVAAFTAQVATSVTYEILEHDPDIYHNSIAQAIRTLVPNGSIRGLYLPVVDETIVVDSIVTNPFFATNTTGPVAFTGWTSIGTPTLAVNTSYFVHGSQSANITPSAVDEGLEQNLLTSANSFGRIDQAVGKTLHVVAFTRATDASNVRLRVTFDGSTYTSSSFHSGDDDWEGPAVHKIDVAIPANLTEMTVSVEGATTTAFQAGGVLAWIDPIHLYTLPVTMQPYGPHRLYQQHDISEPNGLYLPIGVGNTSQSGHLLRLVGMDRLSVPSTDAGTVELDDEQAELLIAQAVSIMHRTLIREDEGKREEHQAEADRWRGEAELLRRTVGMSGLSAHTRDSWKVSDSGGTLSLELVR